MVWVPKWRCLVDAGAMLRHVVGNMATKSAKTRQHRRKRVLRFTRVVPIDARKALVRNLIARRVPRGTVADILHV